MEKILIDHNEILEEMKEAYDSPNWWYDIRGTFILHFMYRDNLFSITKFFSKNMSSEHLEGAIGSGTFAKLCLWYRKIFGPRNKVAGIGFDYTPCMLQGAINKFKKDKNWVTEIGDATNLKYNSEQFQTINVANAFHCFPQPKASIEEFYRVLKPKGTFATNVMFWPESNSLLNKFSRKLMNWAIKKGILYSPYSPEFMREISLAAGFKIEKETRHGNTIHLLLRKP